MEVDMTGRAFKLRCEIMEEQEEKIKRLEAALAKSQFELQCSAMELKALRDLRDAVYEWHDLSGLASDKIVYFLRTARGFKNRCVE